MKYAAADVRATARLHDAMKGDWSKAPAFFIERPQGVYATPHAAPRFNERTGESHAGGCRCEKCCPGSGCQCYACRYEVLLACIKADNGEPMSNNEILQAL